MFLLAIVLISSYFSSQNVSKTSKYWAPDPVGTHKEFAKLSTDQVYISDAFKTNTTEGIFVSLGEKKVLVNSAKKELEIVPMGGDFSNRKKSEGTVNEVYYTDVFRGIDFKYDIYKDHLKEFIILKDVTVEKTIRFEISGDFSFQKEHDGGYSLIDAQQKSYYLYPVSAIDSDGKAINFEMELKQTETGKLELAIFPKDLAQLLTAKYPVSIDPTITWDFPIAAPIINAVNPINGPDFGGTELTISGENFFGYKQNIGITYTGASLTNYVGRLFLDTQTLIAQNKMRSDCGDIRVYQGDVKLDIELRYGCNTTNTEVDITIPEISGNTTLELYYGDLSLEYENVNPLNTFIPSNTLYDFITGHDAFGNDINECGASGCSVLLSNGSGGTSSVAVEVYTFQDDVTYTSNPVIGDTTADTKMLILKYDGNLTINTGVTLAPQVRKKGMIVYVAGELINNGTISMTDRGAIAAGQNVFLYKSISGVIDYIPAAGGAGGAARGTGTGTTTIAIAGLAGTAGSSRSTGGGGSGGVNNCRDTSRGTAYSGAGSAGTSYSGGSGGGGNDMHSTGTYYAGSAAANGGAGGAAFSRRYDSGWAVRYAGGGAGNSGGVGKYTASGQTTGGNNASYSGDAGTGGLLVVYASTFTNAGSLVSLGSVGGSGRAAGGSSGGGSINVFYKDSLTAGTLNASGGAVRAADASGGKGGNGSITTSLFEVFPVIELNPEIVGPEVLIDGLAVENLRIISSTEAKFVNPAHGAGFVSIALTNFDTQSGTLTNNFEYLIAPTFTTITPDNAFPNSILNLTITGGNFRPGLSVQFSSINDNGINCQNIVLIDPATLTCDIDWTNRDWGFWDLRITNPDGQGAYGGNAFYLNPFPPNIFSVVPDFGPVAGGTEVTINGENFIGPAGNGYYRPIPIDYVGNTVTNYHRVLEIDTASIISSGKMRSDCGDLRFRDSDNLTELPYWLESGCNTATTRVTVYFPTISGNKMLYLHYGNPSQTTTSIGVPAVATTTNTLYDYITGDDAFGNKVANCNNGQAGCQVTLSNGAGASSIINVEVYHFNGDVTYTSNPTLGDATADSRMLILVYHGNLTINPGVTMQPQVRKKGMIVYVAGELRNHGNISMTARGAIAAGQNIYLNRNNTGALNFIPAVGGAGGAARSQGSGSGSVYVAGLAGGDGTSRASGGGGSGGVSNCRETSAGTAYSGAGSAGTSYSGGTGGGGIDKHNTGTHYAVSGVANGGAGGDAYSRRINASWLERYAGGGAGNNGGGGRYTGTNETVGSYNASYNGNSGTGGLLIIYSNSLYNEGSIVSQGSIGGLGRAAGGSSGGGSIDLFYDNGFAQGTINASGGAARVASANGGRGGNGSITVNDFNAPILPSVGPEYSLMTVTVGGIPATSVDYINDTTIKIVTPKYLTAEKVDIVVNNAGGEVVSLNDAFLYLPDKYAIISGPSSLREGQAGEYIVQAQDAMGNALIVNYDLEVQLTSSALTGFFARDINEDIETRWNYISFIIESGTSQGKFYYMDNLKGTRTVTLKPLHDEIYLPITKEIHISSKYRFLVTGVTDPIKLGIPSSVTIQAIDWEGKPLHDYTGTIHFTSSDLAAIVPTNQILGPENLSGNTYTNGVTFLTANSTTGWCVNVTDTVDPDISGEQCGIVVDEADGNVPAKLAFITNPQNMQSDMISNTITVQMQDAGGNAASRTTDTMIYIFTGSTSGEFSINGVDNWVSEPLQLTIPAYATSANFYYRNTTLGAHVFTAGDDVDEANDYGLTNTSQTINVLTGTAYSFEIISEQTNIVAGLTSEILTVNLKDIDNNVTNSIIKQPVYISATNQGQISADGINWSTTLGTYILAGNSTTQFYFKSNKAGSATITVSDNAPADGNTGLIDALKLFNVNPADFAKYRFISNPFQMIAGAVSPQVQFEILDAYNNRVTLASNTTVYLYSTNIDTAFSVSTDFAGAITNVVIPAGSSTGAFYVKQNTNIPNITITLSDNNISPDGDTGIKDVNQTILLIPGSIARFVVTNISPINIVAGEESQMITVELRNNYGVRIPTLINRTVFLHSTASGFKEFSLQPAPLWEAATYSYIPANSAAMDFYYKSNLVSTHNIVVGDDESIANDANVINANAAISINPAKAAKLEIISNESELEIGKRSQAITIRLKDAFDNIAVADAQTTIALNSTSLNGVFVNAEGQILTQVNIPSANSTATIYYIGNTVGLDTLSFTSDGLTAASKELDIMWGTVTELRLSGDSQMLTAGEVSQPITITTYNSSGVLVPVAQDLSILLQSSHISGRFDSDAAGAFDGSLNTIIMSAGQNQTIFYFKDTLATSVNLTFSSISLNTLNTTFNIIPAAFNHLKITTPVQTLQAGQVSGIVRVQLFDVYENLTVHDIDLEVQWASSSVTGRFDTVSNGGFTNSVASITTPAGLSENYLYYKDIVANTATLTASPLGFSGDSQQINYIWGTATRSEITSATNSMVAGAVSDEIVVRLYNAYDINIEATNDITLNISSNSPTAKFDIIETGDFSDTTIALVLNAGQSYKSFYFKDITARTTTISVNTSGLPQASKLFTITADIADRLAFRDVSVLVVEAGQISNEIILDVQDRFGNITKVTTDTNIFLHSNIEAKFYNSEAVEITNLVVPTNASQIGFSYKALVSGVDTIQVTDLVYPDDPDHGLTNTERDVEITHGAITSFSLSSASNTAIAGQASALITLTAYNQYGIETIASSDVLVQLTSNVVTGKFDTINTGEFNSTAITLAANASRQGFYYKGTTTGSQKITATSTGINEATFDITLISGTLNEVRFLNAPTNLKAGYTSAVFTLGFFDEFGNSKILENDLTIDLSSSDIVNGTFAKDLSGLFGVTQLIANTGAASANFYYKDTFNGAKIITIASGSLIGDSSSINVVGGDIARIDFITAEQTIRAQRSSQVIQARVYDAYNNQTTTASNLIITLSTNSANAEFSLSATTWNSINQLTMNAGQGTISFYYKDWVVGNSTITVKNVTLGIEDSQIHDIVPGEPFSLNYTSTPQTIITNTASDEITFELRDSSGYLTSTLVDLPINVSASSGEFSLNGEDNWNQSLILTVPTSATSGRYFYRNTTPGSYSLNISADGLTPAAQDIQVIYGEISKLKIVATTDIVAGQIVPVSISTLTENDLVAAVLEDTIVTLQSTNANVKFSLSETTWLDTFELPFNVGQDTKVIYMRQDQVGDFTITANKNPWQLAEHDFTVVSADFYKFEIIANPAEVSINSVSAQFAVQMQDQFGNPVNALYDTSVYFYTSGSGSFSSDGTTWPELAMIIPAGLNIANFYYQDAVPGSKTIIVSDKAVLDNPDIEIRNASTTIYIRGDVATKIVVSSDVLTTIAGQYSHAITITAYKADNSLAILDSDLTVELGSIPAGGYLFKAIPDNGANIITNIVIPQGGTSVTVYYLNTIADVYELSFTSGFLVTNKLDFTVLSDSAQKLVFTSDLQTKMAGESSAIFTINIQDQYNNIAKTIEEMHLTIDKELNNMQFSLDGEIWVPNLNNVTLASGSSSFSFYAKGETVGAWDITLRELDNKLTSATQEFTINASGVFRIVFVDTQVEQLIAGQVSQAKQIKLKDMFGNDTITSVPLNVYLYSSSTKTNFGSDPALTNLITRLTIPANGASASFYYRTNEGGDFVLYASDQSILDNPVDIGIINANVNYQVNWGTSNEFYFISNNSSMVAGGIKTIEIGLKNEYGLAMPANDSLLGYIFSSHAASGKFSKTNDFATINDSFTIAKNAYNATIYYTDSEAGNATITVADVNNRNESPDLGILNKSYIQNILPAEVYRLVLISAFNPDLEVGTPNNQLIVQTQDQYGNAITMLDDLPIYLYSDKLGQWTNSIAFTHLITEAIIPAGSSTTAIYYKPLISGDHNIVVSDKSPIDSPDIDLVNITRIYNVYNGNIVKLAFDSDTVLPFEAGSHSGLINVKALNQYGIEIPAISDVPLYLFTSSSKGSFSTDLVDWTVSSITLNSGSSSINFYYKDNDYGMMNLTVSDKDEPLPDSGWNDALTTIESAKGEATQLKIVSLPQTIVANHPSYPFKVELQNHNGIAIVSDESTNIYLRTDSNQGMFGETINTNWGLNYVIIQAGNKDVTFYYQDKKIGIANIQVSDNLPLVPDTNLTNDSQEVNVIEQTVAYLKVVNISDPQKQGSPSSVVVSARDIMDHIVTTYDGTVSFTSGSMGETENDITNNIPDIYTFDPTSDKGIKTFKNAVAFASSGEKWVKAEDENGFFGMQQDITVGTPSQLPVAKLAFIDTNNPLLVKKGITSQEITIELQDYEGQSRPAYEGGFPVILSTGNANALFSLSADGPWVASAVYVIPEGFSFLNLYFKSDFVGDYQLLARDYLGGIDDPGIENAILNIEVNSLDIRTDLQVEVFNNPRWWVENPRIFARNNDGMNRFRISMPIQIFDEKNNTPLLSNIQVMLKDPSGLTLENHNIVDASNYTFTLSDITNNSLLSGIYQLSVSATSQNGELDNTRTFDIPISEWVVKITYNENDRILGDPLPIEVLTYKAGVLTDVPDGFELKVNFKDDNGNDLADAKFTKLKDALTHAGSGMYSGEMPSEGLVVDEAYYLFAQIYDVTAGLRDEAGQQYPNDVYAEDNHYDIFFKNNPALAPENFRIHKDMLSIGPASEQYNLRFTWNYVENATRYNLYRSKDKFSTLFADPCTIEQVKNNHRFGKTGASAPYCETTLLDQEGTDVNTQWVKVTTINAPATEYTIPWNIASNDDVDSSYFWILRAENALGESGYSTMVFSLRKNMVVNTTNANTNWISIPYYTDYMQGLNIVNEIEGGVDLNRNKKLSSISKWKVGTQNAEYFSYSPIIKRWSGTNFVIDMGDGVSVVLNGTANNFVWTIVGNDDYKNLSFNLNVGIQNTNWISMPYTGMHKYATDVINDLEGGTGLGYNLKVSSISSWNPMNQNAEYYSYSPILKKWLGNNFLIKPGDGISIVLSGNTNHFEFIPYLILDPYEDL